MVLEIIHLIIMTATLTCGLVVAWYGHRIHAALARELAFLDARDLDQRRHRAEARHAGQAWNKELSNWHRDTRAILGKLYAIAAESSPEERDTRLIPPPPTPPPSIPETSPRPGAAPVSRERPSPGAQTTAAYRAVSPPASASVLASAPALVAAGMGPRPPASSLVSTRRPPPITVADPPSPSRPAPSRRATVMGLQPVDEGAPDRVSWEALKHTGGLGGSTQPARIEQRFPGTMLSMPSATAPTSSRPIAPVETKSICHGCDGGFVAVGHGGIGKCHDCDGSGFIDAR
jgi:hypothetical protein